MLKRHWDRLGLDKRLRAIYTKYERLFIPGFLVVGFVFDIITFRTLQINTTLRLLFVYAVGIILMIAYIHLYDDRPKPPKSVILNYLRFLASFATQIAMGALLSSALLFYWFSGSFSVSWPLFALTTGVMVSSEIFRRIYLKPTVQLGVYNFALLSYFSVLLPFVLRSLSGWTFILAGVMSTLVTLLLALFLAHFSSKIRPLRSSLFASIMSVFALMSALYVFKLIPPLPLSITEAGIYHNIQRQAGEYILTGDDENFFQRLIPGQKIYANLNESIYAYTAIFVPADLSTEIYHLWEYKDPLSDKWVDRNLLHFSAHGGRQQGYRGYTTKTGLAPGQWRVTVQNSRGQVLGRLKFTVESH
ncbi:MAG: DUF2914 domain-containing protein [Patescibacteria group bacterium]